MLQWRENLTHRFLKEQEEKIGVFLTDLFVESEISAMSAASVPVSLRQRGGSFRLTTHCKSNSLGRKDLFLLNSLNVCLHKGNPKETKWITISVKDKIV